MANFQLTQTGQQIQADLDLLDNNSATSGQVLTADGSGGASWQNASGGDKLYRHNIAISIPYGTRNQYGTVCIITKSSTAMTLSDLNTYLYDNGYVNYAVNHAGLTVNIPFAYSTESNVLFIYSSIYYNTSSQSSRGVLKQFTFDFTNGSISESQYIQYTLSAYDVVDTVVEI